ncbi:unnamed protein product [Prorocentrum cordatum]|uniref:Uncharacterized protein n=1 Tax=Prorocentrum cordatum TaxID=2364126 RepID=A0ABN9RU70_9DINO|nr:unnamed protein product [Polarella glacialis]
MMAFQLEFDCFRFPAVIGFSDDSGATNLNLRKIFDLNLAGIVKKPAENSKGDKDQPQASCELVTVQFLSGNLAELTSIVMEFLQVASRLSANGVVLQARAVRLPDLDVAKHLELDVDKLLDLHVDIDSRLSINVDADAVDGVFHHEYPRQPRQQGAGSGEGVASVGACSLLLEFGVVDGCRLIRSAGSGGGLPFDPGCHVQWRVAV